MRILVLAFLATVMSTSVAQTQSDRSDKLLNMYEKSNSACRDGDSGNQSTMKACSDRENFAKRLNAIGWCWGPDGAPAYKQGWAPCGQFSAPTAGHQKPEPALFYAVGRILENEIVLPRNIFYTLYIKAPCNLPIVNAEHMRELIETVPGAPRRTGCWGETLGQHMVFVFEDGETKPWAKNSLVAGISEPDGSALIMGGKPYP